MTATLARMSARIPVAILSLLALGGCTQPAPEPPPAPETAMPEPENPPADPTRQAATFGAGCFWCVEAVLDRIDGVLAVASGYMGGRVDQPSYEQVCRGTTGHAEVVQVEFDPQVITYPELLDLFFQLHDPTTLNRQGNDTGTQYRSAIFVHSDQQREAATAAIAKWQPKFRDPIVTEVTAAGTFWPAEDYHQDYWAKNPGDRYCRAFIPPKLEKLGLDEREQGEREDGR